ncbi:GNAT family N-acetyltransferase [Methanorbis rubei]
MEEFSLHSVTTSEDINSTAELADSIWTEHYVPIIGRDQTRYMIEKFQSADAIHSQIEQENYLYYLLKVGQASAGYISLHFEPESHVMFLSKFYVEKSFRGRGFSRAALQFIEEICRQESLTTIYLTVNKQNFSSLAVYEKLGFVRAREMITDIGNGYAMDDYVMEKYL